jgi:putative ABC transport system permease protein
MALGAESRQIVWLFFQRMLVVLVIGSVVGMSGALAGGRVMRGFLVDTSPTDPATLASTTLLLALVAIIATVMPARRALRIDPAVALRCD